MAKFWELFKKIEEASPDAAPAELAVQGQAALTDQDKSLLDSLSLRRGMWVTTPSGIGICTGVYKGFIEVQLTDPAGANLGPKQNFETGKVGQAKHMQIPQPRRPSAEVAKAMGY